MGNMFAIFFTKTMEFLRAIVKHSFQTKGLGQGNGHSLVLEAHIFTRVFQLSRPFLCTGPDLRRLDAPLVGECKHLVAGQKGRVKHVSEVVVWSQISENKMLHFIVYGRFLMA